MDRLPLGRSGRTLLGLGAPWYETWLQNTDPDDGFWRPARLDAALDRTRIPVLLVGGWQDLFLEQTLEQYRRLRANGAQPVLHVGPWTHMDMLTKAVGPVAREALAIAHRFRVGTRIRLVIAGGSHPRYARNLGTGEPPLTAFNMKPCTRVVTHGAGGTSVLHLPVVAERGRAITAVRSGQLEPNHARESRRAAVRTTPSTRSGHI